MRPGHIRAIALCVCRHEGRILAAEHHEPISGQRFYRPLGGTIEFGETSADAVRREFQEELGATLTELRYLGTLENVFTYNGQRGHEIVFIYDGRLADASLYERPVIEGHEDSGAPIRACWLSLDDCLAPGAPPVYPTGLLALLAAP